MSQLAEGEGRTPGEDVLDRPEAGATAIRGAAIRTALFAAGLLLNLATVPFMIRHLGAVDYGYYVSVASIVFIVGAVTDAGLTNLGVRYWVTSDAPARRSLLSNLIGLRLVLTTIGIGIATGLTALAGAPSVVVAGTAVYGAGLLISTIAYTYSVPLLAVLRLGSTAALDFLRSLSLAASTLVLVVVGAGLMAFFGAYVFSSVAAMIATLALIRNRAAIRPAFHRETWIRFLRETASYALASAVGLIYFRVAMVLISFLSTDVQAGYYAAPFRVIEVATNVPWLFVTSVFPILARAATDDLARLRYALQRMAEVGLICGVWMSITLIAEAEWVIDLVAGDDFGPSIPVLRIQAATLVATFVISTWSMVLLSRHHHRPLLVTNLLALGVAAVAAIALIGPYGAKGAAITTLVTEVFLAGAYIVALRRSEAELRLDLGFLPKLLLATGLAALVALLGLPPVPTILAMSAVYLGALFALRAVPTEILHALRHRGG